MMDAPLYPPAQAYEEPRLVQATLGVDEVSVVDLLRGEATRAILDQEVPGLSGMVRAPQLRATASNVTLREMATFSFSARLFKEGAIERVDARLRALPASSWPGL
jgi:hypothetical protein